MARRYRITLDSNDVPSSELMCKYDLTPYLGWPMGTGWDSVEKKLWMTSFWPQTNKPSLVGPATLT